MSKFHDGQTYLQLYTSPEVSNPLRLKRVYYGDNLAIMALILYIVWQVEWKRSTYLLITITTCLVPKHYKQDI